MTQIKEDLSKRAVSKHHPPNLSILKQRLIDRLNTTINSPNLVEFIKGNLYFFVHRRNEKLHLEFEGALVSNIFEVVYCESSLKLCIQKSRLLPKNIASSLNNPLFPPHTKRKKKSSLDMKMTSETHILLTHYLKRMMRLLGPKSYNLCQCHPIKVKRKFQNPQMLLFDPSYPTLHSYCINNSNERFCITNTNIRGSNGVG
ncbi:hypothetical protein AMTR_s00055p00072530 [Amborella trichopoda]|uniref:Uncharacterized protein n=1 Tax=Amborella trichopoda TaxID=13333 RepID=U5DCU9_AMBTC|nr:hypothetical protein AMTR_s00055p00072530 [Amborella trichopoda]